MDDSWSLDKLSVVVQCKASQQYVKLHYVDRDRKVDFWTLFTLTLVGRAGRQIPGYHVEGGGGGDSGEQARHRCIILLSPSSVVTGN
ncbi:unnamed protein product [Strongylus vulgaris]|uniref:Uncharacterized protein n=1 Tax=Strongylus vulgaris TaxID=40348 RepID=A0A3P7J096_STRVU|nr:unnamed protein product [Strongylus vulgaris]